MPQTIIAHYVSRIVVGSNNVTVTLKPTVDNIPSAIEIPWAAPTKHERPRIEATNQDTARTPNPQLVQAIVRAYTWIRLLSDGTQARQRRASSRHSAKILRSLDRLAGDAVQMVPCSAHFPC